jgi:hypothetical protein
LIFEHFLELEGEGNEERKSYKEKSISVGQEEHRKDQKNISCSKRLSQRHQRKPINMDTKRESAFYAHVYAASRRTLHRQHTQISKLQDTPTGEKCITHVLVEKETQIASIKRSGKFL